MVFSSPTNRPSLTNCEKAWTKNWNLLYEREAEILALGLEAGGGGSEEAGGRAEQQVVVQHFHLFDWRLAGPRVGLRRLGLKWATAPANCPAALCPFLALELLRVLLAVDDSGLSDGGRLSRRPSAQDGSYLGGFPSCGSHANQVCGAAPALPSSRALLDHGRRRGARAAPRSTLALFLRRSPPPAGGAWREWYEWHSPPGANSHPWSQLRADILYVLCSFTTSFLMKKDLHMTHMWYSKYFKTHDTHSTLCHQCVKHM